MQIITVCGIRWHQWLAWQQHFFDIFCFMLWHLAFLSSSEGDIRQLLEEKDLQCIIKQLSIRFCDMQNYQCLGKKLSDSPSARLITLTSTLIISYITKTSSNKCLICYSLLIKLCGNTT